MNKLAKILFFLFSFFAAAMIAIITTFQSIVIFDLDDGHLAGLAGVILWLLVWWALLEIFDRTIGGMWSSLKGRH